MWFNSAQMYMLLSSSSVPLLVKFDDSVCYLPVFESKQCAKDALKNLGGATGEHVLKNFGPYEVAAFSWELFRKQHQHHKELGIMLFVYPMAAEDYGQGRK